MREKKYMTTKDISMIDVSEKEITKRTAIASGKIYLLKETLLKIKKREILKGDPLIVGEVAAINAIKMTSQLIPLCHQIPIKKVDFKTKVTDSYVEVKVIVIALAQTGVEMEALVGVSTFLNVIWDMTKYLEKDEEGQYPNTKISDIRVEKKEK